MGDSLRWPFAAGVAIVTLGLGVATWTLLGKNSDTGADTPAHKTQDQLAVDATSITPRLSPARSVPSGSPSYQYNAQGQLAVIRYPDGSTYTCSYDSHGDKVQETESTGKTWVYIYDQQQHPIKVIDPQGHAVQIAAKPGRP